MTSQALDGDRSRPSVLLLTQYFHPEIPATAQLMTDLAVSLAERGRKVEVFTGQPSYVKRERLAPRERYKGVTIRRLYNPGKDRRSTRGRLTNFAFVSAIAFLRLAVRPRSKVLVVDTTSPFLPITAWLLRVLRRQRYVMVVEDVYPDIAVCLGHLKPKGIVTRAWHRLNRITYGGAELVVALGPRMRERVLPKLPHKADPARVRVIHNWADGDLIHPRPKEENWFCRDHGLVGKTVVLYSGNMGLGHDLETVVEVARLLREHHDIKFVFIGDGGKRPLVEELVKKHALGNVLLLPYQPAEALPFSLSAGDIAIVALEPGIEGLSVPSKLYAYLAAGQAIAALVQEGSEVADIVAQEECGFRVSQGDVEGLLKQITRLCERPELLRRMRERSRACFEANFTRAKAIAAYEGVLAEAAG